MISDFSVQSLALRMSSIVESTFKKRVNRFKSELLFTSSHKSKSGQLKHLYLKSSKSHMQPLQTKGSSLFSSSMVNGWGSQSMNFVAFSKRCWTRHTIVARTVETHLEAQ
jgi:hypothetical protein